MLTFHRIEKCYLLRHYGAESEETMKNGNIIRAFSTASISALIVTFIFVRGASTTVGAQSVSASSGVADFVPLALNQVFPYRARQRWTTSLLVFSRPRTILRLSLGP